MKKIHKLALAAPLALMLASTGTQADTAVDKFGRGLAGMTLGVLELPGNIVKETKAKGPVGIPVGLAMGVGMIVTRELVGVYEFLSAPFPVPAGYRPILHPEYPWGYFK
jgi:putative exosortase-associated protein (TIGR04073 family)